MKRTRVDAIGTELRTENGMVSSLHPAAANAAARVLEDGGSPYDAALTGLATLAIVEPFMSGIGGHGAAIVAAPGQPAVVIDASARGPSAADAGHDVPRRGPGAVPVPMAIAGWHALHALGGQRPVANLLDDAAGLAREGYEIAWYTALMIASHARLLRQDPHAASLYLGDEGLPPAAATTFRDSATIMRNPDLGRALEAVGRRDLASIMKGDIGRAFATATAGGPLAAADLARIRAIVPTEALDSTFRGWSVHSGPVTSGAATLIAMLHQLEDLDPTLVPLGSADYYERLIDAQRAAMVDRDHLGDPDFGPVPVEALISPELAALRKADLDAARLGDLPARVLSVDGYPEMPHKSIGHQPEDGTSTTHINVIGPDGTAIAATFTLGYPFGAGIVAPMTGSLMGNTLHQFTPVRHHPNATAPGKRAAWNGAPTILRKEGAVIAVGAPGGERIAGAVAQVLVAHLVYGLSPQRAIEVPRAFASNGSVYLDDRIDVGVIEELRGRGRTVEAVREGPFTSNFARPGLLHRAADGHIRGGIDPWRLGTVAGF